MAGGSEKGRSTQGGVTISLRQAARELEKEQERELGKVLFKWDALRKRYRWMKEKGEAHVRQLLSQEKGTRSRRKVPAPAARDKLGRYVKGNIPWDNRFQRRDKIGRFSQPPAVKKPESGGIPAVKEPESGGIPAPKKREKPSRYTVAMDLATIATSQLSRIEVDDPKREIAFERVIIWITENRYGRKGDSAWQSGKSEIGL
jgi:hypothetical protein